MLDHSSTRQTKSGMTDRQITTATYLQSKCASEPLTTACLAPQQGIGRRCERLLCKREHFEAVAGLINHVLELG